MTSDQPLPPDGEPVHDRTAHDLLAAGLETARDDTPSPAELADVFPELEIQSVIGRGGMGVVYRARQVHLDRLVALKLLPHDLAADTNFSERFAREARALARLDHPNIVKVHEFGEREGHHHLLLEYVDGVNLRQAMGTGDLTPEQALAIVPKLCDALQYAHEQGVVHRDVKPENVLLAKDGSVKITDFGLALLAEPEREALTRVGQVMGTPHYMAPEQIEHPGEVDHRADIYSLGVVFYEMLTGELPLGRFEPPSRKVEVDVRFDEVVLRALEKERDQRYQKASEVRTEIDGIRSGATPVRRATPVPATRAAAEPVEARTSRLAIAAASMPVVGLVLPLLVALIAGNVGGGMKLGVAAFALPMGVLQLVSIVLAVIAMVRINGSGGALKGMGLALVGLLLPLVLVCGGLGSSFLLFRAAPVGPAMVSSGGGVTVIGMPARNDDPHVIEHRVVAVASALGMDPSGEERYARLREHVAPSERDRLPRRSTDPALARGEYGLVGLVTGDDMAERVSSWAGALPIEITFQDSADRASVMIEGMDAEGEWMFDFVVVREDGDWWLSTSPAVSGIDRVVVEEQE